MDNMECITTIVFKTDSPEFSKLIKEIIKAHGYEIILDTQLTRER